MAVKRTPYLLGAVVPLMLAAAAWGQNKRDTTVREDKAKLANDQSWFYDDFAKATQAAAKTKRPLMVVFR